MWLKKVFLKKDYRLQESALTPHTQDISSCSQGRDGDGFVLPVVCSLFRRKIIFSKKDYRLQALGMEAYIRQG